MNVLQLINESKWEALEQMGKMKLQHGGGTEAGGPDGKHISFKAHSHLAIHATSLDRQFDCVGTIEI